MTTTELIDFLRKYERGGATGKSREIDLCIRLKGKKPIYITRPQFKFGGSGDGLITDIWIDVFNEN